MQHVTTTRVAATGDLDVPPQSQTCSMTRQLRLIEDPKNNGPTSGSRKLNNQTRDLGRKGIAASRAALAAARQLPDIDLDAA